MMIISIISTKFAFNARFTHRGQKKRRQKREKKIDDGNGNGIARPFFIIPFITFSIKRFGVCRKIFPPLSSDDGQGREPEKRLDGLDSRGLVIITVFLHTN